MITSITKAPLPQTFIFIQKRIKSTNQSGVTNAQRFCVSRFAQIFPGSVLLEKTPRTISFSIVFMKKNEMISFPPCTGDAGLSAARYR